MKIVRTMQSNNRLDKLPEELQTRIWAYHLADRLKKVVFLKHGLSDKALSVLHSREPSVGAKLVSNNFLFVSKFVVWTHLHFGIRWKGGGDHAVDTSYTRLWLLQLIYRLGTHRSRPSLQQSTVADGLTCCPLTQRILKLSLLQNAPGKFHFLSYKWALRDLKRGKGCNIDFEKQNPAFFGSLSDAKREVLGLLKEIHRQEQRKIDAKADAFVRGNN